MLRIIGDAHCKSRKYREVAQAAEYSVQVGDLGYSSTYQDLLEDATFDVECHKFFPGNHDDYDFISYYRNHERFKDFYLGDYGMRTHGGVSFYMVRGAFSIDWKPRLQQEQIFGVRSWWPNEELSLQDHDQIVEDFAKAKPDVVLAHETAQNVGRDGVLKTNWILERFGFDPATFTTNTGELLQRMLQEHKPKLFVHGHYHKNHRYKELGIEFVCLEELGYLEI